MTKRKKPDGRKNNGSESRGLTEATVLVRGPAALLEAMKARARRDEVSVSESWRRAAGVYLGAEVLR